jgi:hypothetical protein
MSTSFALNFVVLEPDRCASSLAILERGDSLAGGGGSLTGGGESLAGGSLQ